MRLRPATDDDRDVVLALGVTEEEVWFGVAETAPSEVGEWVDQEGGLGTGVVAMDDAGAVHGFAAPGQHEAVLLADPARIDELADVLLPWLRGSRADVQLMTFGSDRARVAALERHGFEHRRSSFTLARPAAAGPIPPAAFPEGVEVAAYRLGEDDAAVHRLIYVDAAWTAVPGHVGRDFDTWREMMRPYPSLLLARRDGCPVGWAGGRIQQNGRGYVAALAVATTERGRGLGRALLLQVMAELERAGASDLTIGVVADNEGALGLYRSVGFQVEREWRTFTT